MIRRLADDFGKTVVVVLHDINVAAHHADRIVAMRDGRIVADGTPNEVVVASTMRDVFGLDVEITEHRGRPVVLHFVA